MFHCDVSFSLILQQMKLASRNIAIIGLVVTITAAVLIADWQSIPYDPCTEFSPFHHPEVNFTAKRHNSTNLQKRADVNCHSINTTLDLENVYIQVQVNHFDGGIKHCHKIQSCPECYEDEDHAPCLDYTIGSGLACLVPTTRFSEHRQNVSHLVAYSCSTARSTVSVCILWDKLNLTHGNNNSFGKHLTGNVLNAVHTQTLSLMTNGAYNAAVNQCEAMSTSSYQCHWLPFSLITKHHCYDCQPICRSTHQTLNFVQFTIGAALLMASLPLAWVPMAAILSYRVHKEAQVILHWVTYMHGLDPATIFQYHRSYSMSMC